MNLKKYNNIYYFDRDIRHFFLESFKHEGILPVNSNTLELVTKNDLVLFTYPNWSNPKDNQFEISCRDKKIHTVAIIYDLQFPYHGHNRLDVQNLNLFTYIIAQSEEMKKSLEIWNIKSEIVVMEFFDYPYFSELVPSYLDALRDKKRQIIQKYELVYFGKIFHNFRRWLFSKALKDIKIYTYYQLNTGEINEFNKKNIFKNLEHAGIYTDDDIFNGINGHFSIMWNGDDRGEDFFAFKRLSISSKVDCSIASLTPMIAKKGTADAHLIEKYDIGFTIDNLNEINDKLKTITYCEYQKYIENLLPLAINVTNGFYFKKALYEITTTRILITGAENYIGKNLITALKKRTKSSIDTFDLDRNIDNLESYCKNADFIFHLAEYSTIIKEIDDNSDFLFTTKALLEFMEKYNNYCPIVVALTKPESVQSPNFEIEQLLIEFRNKTGSRVSIFTLPSIFGKEIKQNIVSNICEKVIENNEIEYHEFKDSIEFIYIDDIVNEFINALHYEYQSSSPRIRESFFISVDKIFEIINGFHISRKNGVIPDTTNYVVKKFYNTYLSHLSVGELVYPLKINENEIEFFIDVLSKKNSDNLVINIIKPDFAKNEFRIGIEKILILSGSSVVSLKKEDAIEVIELPVCGEYLKIIDIPPEFLYSISNIGKSNLVAVLWKNEVDCDRS